MNYTLHQLHIFLKIAELKSITKAAETLHLTQPAVSIQLKNFQDQFPIPLTEVVGRQLYVTDFGLEIATAAEKILNEVHAINYKTLAYKGQLSGRLKISTVSTGKYVMPYFLSGFMKQNEGVDLIMDVTNKTRVVESLELNTVDFALVSVLPKKLKVNKITLMQNKLYFIASNNLEIRKGMSRKKIFEELPLIYREQGSATRNAMETFIANNNFSVRKTIELTSNEAVKQAVLSGLGCSIMPLIGIRNELRNKELQILTVKGLPIVTAWNLIWLKSKKLSPPAVAYLEYLNKEKERVIDEKFAWVDTI
ncbi:LysR family transcriptional regulator [Subsaximicrobium wynnwilliamsii]|uniref:LysR family transcriptional regulator n=1 Tax=Subsaximicrobium wynnwilliamsii TaxID=291179 RepID=A0A5C6ZIV5_9FLAO|nr:LysR family transcriptional regulator [Subsaximicrobium wynnwilliamsii]TXD84443.1 LysR family transcriptional regulator [Subsaximicrobium wynnwilliamsii]TXD90124.1 LysR family transcriptional regulator [Subsaximicrobium wynnwilliamsii]TXE04176.1 LysR family transcriptional regulator [Subsaximicrobium wynnwilliamsii]